MWWALLVATGSAEVPVLGVVTQHSAPAWVAYGNSIYPNFTALDLDTFTWFYWDAPLNVTPVQVDPAVCVGQLADGTAYVYAPQQHEDRFNEAYSRHGFSVRRSSTQLSSPYEVRHFDIAREHDHGVDYTWFELAVGTGHFVEAAPLICRSFHTCRFPNGEMAAGYDTDVVGQFGRELPVPSVLFTTDDLGLQWLKYRGTLLLRQTLVVNGSVAPVFRGEACEHKPVVLCRPPAGTARLDGPGCKRVSEEDRPGALLVAAAVLLVWLAHARFEASKPDIASLRELLTGFMIWWPANVIGDGMPLFAAQGTDVAVAMLAMTLGGVAVLLPWPETAAALRGLALLGCTSLALTFVSMPVAAFAAGFAGSGATAIVWGIARNAKSVGVGMTLSAVVSSVAVLVCPTSAGYVLFSAAVAGAGLYCRPQGQPSPGKEADLPEVEEAFIDSREDRPAVDLEPAAETSEGAPKPPSKFRDNGVYFVFYALAYALPGVLPELGLSTPEYKWIIALGTAGDILGRLFSGKSSPAHLPCCVLAFVAVIMSEQYLSRALLVVGFYAIRGDAVVLLASRAGKGTKIGVFGQLGGAAGALATALLVSGMGLG